MGCKACVACSTGCKACGAYCFILLPLLISHIFNPYTQVLDLTPRLCAVADGLPLNKAEQACKVL